MRHPLDIECPLCRAEPGQVCVGVSGRERKTFHRARGTRKKAPHPVYWKAGFRTESPIEQSLLAAIIEWLDHSELNGIAAVETQTAIGPFRADILVTDGSRKLVVECDGAEFHAITEEQVRRDKRRDRYCAARGICVMRFTGAEIHRDRRGCAAEIGLWIKLA